MTKNERNNANRNFDEMADELDEFAAVPSKLRFALLRSFFVMPRIQRRNLGTNNESRLHLEGMIQTSP